MNYFSNFGQILYTLDSNLVDFKSVTNIFTKVKFVKEVLNNSQLFYTYDMNEGDTPEIIAHKLYGDPNRYWMVMFANEYIDPYYDVPLKYQAFDNYLTDKYGSIANAQSQIHHHEKQVTVNTNKNGAIDNQMYITELTSSYYDNSTNSILPNTLATLNTPIIPISTESILIPDSDGINVDITVTTNHVAVTVYDYEVSVNENKRNINVVDADFAGRIETEFANLLT